MKINHPIRRFRDSNKHHAILCEFFSQTQNGNASYVYWVINQLKCKQNLINYFSNNTEKY